MIYFVFESDENELFINFTKCQDLNPSGIPRFTVSPLVTEIRQLRSQGMKIPFSTKIPKNKKYIIASGVAHSPDFWTGKFKKTPSGKTIFEFLNKKYLNDLINEKAFLLLDQSHEGYHETWLWEWFHDECSRFDIPASQIIYVTGNLKSDEQYKHWALTKNIKKTMKIIPYAHFEQAMAKMITDVTPSVRHQINYKKKNKDNIKLYNCLQKRPRNHRTWLFKKLYDHDLIEQGINSMNLFEKNNSYMDEKTISDESYQKIIKLLPMLPPTDSIDKINQFSSQDCGDYLVNFNEQITLDSWISVVSEASFSDSLNTCFLSEKTFKPIACSHPFIIYGNKNSLTHLKLLGYKTFHPYINESYDKLNTWDRLDAIIEELNRLKNFSYKEKLNWYKQVSPILKYNKKILMGKRTNPSETIKNLINSLKD